MDRCLIWGLLPAGGLCEAKHGRLLGAGLQIQQRMTLRPLGLATLWSGVVVWRPAEDYDPHRH
jgi:hypothetical protein